MTPTIRSAAQTGTILVILAGVAILAYLDHLTSSDAFSVIMLVGGGTAVAGGIALGSTPITGLIPHYILIAAVVAMTVALAIKGVFVPQQTIGVFSLILGAGAFGTGSAAVTTKVALSEVPKIQTTAVREKVALLDETTPPGTTATSLGMAPPLPLQGNDTSVN